MIISINPSNYQKVTEVCSFGGLSGLVYKTLLEDTKHAPSHVHVLLFFWRILTACQQKTVETKRCNTWTS
jgi:hypothetical protein